MIKRVYDSEADYIEGIDEELADRIRKTLFIERSYSICGNCGKQTLIKGKKHRAVSGWGPDEPGCMMHWEYLSTHYALDDETVQHIKQLRPDLEYWDYFSDVVRPNLNINDA